MPASTDVKLRYCCYLFSKDKEALMNEMERKFINALSYGDVPTIEQMLSSEERSIRHEIQGVPVATLIVRSLSPNMIKMAFGNYPDLFIGRPQPFDEWFDRLREGTNGPQNYWVSTGKTVTCVETSSRCYDIFDLLYEFISRNSSTAQLMEAIFGQSSDERPSPFTRACMMGKTNLVAKFLDMITDETREYLREESFIYFEKRSARNRNLFHYANSLPFELLNAIIDRLPFSRSLINANNPGAATEHPLLSLTFWDQQNSARIARMFVLNVGTEVDPLNQRGRTPLHMAIEYGCLEMIECFLRMGARTDIVDREGSTALSLALRFGDSPGYNARVVSSRMIFSSKMIELLLAFGVDLGKEACLRPPVPPNPNQDGKKSVREVLRDLRDSNSINSLIRLCRKVIRRQMGPNADEKIKVGVTDIPEHLKLYLLVENESKILARSN